MSRNTPSSDRYPADLYLAVLANLFFFASFHWVFATLPGYIQQIGGGPAQIGLAYGLFTLSAVASRPGIGRLIDLWGRKPMLLAGAVIFTLSPLLYTQADSIGTFMIARLFHGVGIAAFTTAYTALVADLAPPLRRGEAIGLSGVTSLLGLLFAPALGLWVQTTEGYAVHFVAAAGIAAVSILLLLPTREPGLSDPDAAEHPRLRDVAWRRPVWLAALGSTGLAVAYGAVLSFLPPFAAERRLAAVGAYFSAFAVAMMLAQSAAGWLSDRIGRRAVAVPGMVMVVLSTAGLARAQTDAALLAAGAGLGLSWGLIRASLDTSVVDAVSPDARGTALGFLYTCFDIGVGAGSFGLGFVAQARGYDAALYVAAIWGSIALAGYLTWERRKPNGP
jgi:predicted MFS family arabinose efflux permease